MNEGKRMNERGSVGPDLYMYMYMPPFRFTDMPKSVFFELKHFCIDITYDQRDKKRKYRYACVHTQNQNYLCLILHFSSLIIFPFFLINYYAASPTFVALHFSVRPRSPFA